MGSYGKKRPRKLEVAVTVPAKPKKVKVVEEVVPAAAKPVVKKAAPKKTAKKAE